MVKNKILTPVLAAVLGVTVVGSGVAYYFVNSDKAAKDDGKTVKSSLSDVKADVKSTIEQAQKAVNGELDFAYDSSVKLTFGDGVTQLAGSEIKPVEFTTTTKQKGTNTEADFAVKYNDTALCSLNAVYSRDNKTAYLQVPELNSAYLSANADDTKTAVDSILAQSGTSISALTESVPTGEDIDFDALEKDMESYVDTIKEKLPEAKDGENVSGDIDGNEYSYTTKTYSISGTDVQNVVNAVVDKASTDENIKKVFDEYAAQAGTTYDDLMSQLKTSITEDFSTWEDAGETVDFNIYYDGEDVTGLSMSQDGVEMNMVIIDTDTVEAIDMNVKADDNTMTAKGSVKLEDEKANGSYTYSVVSADTNMTAKVSMEDVKSSDDVFSGKISTEYSVTSADTTVSGWTNITSDSTADSTKLTVDVGMNDADYVTMDISMNKTEASDVTVPTGTIYNALNEEQLNTYMTTCDVDGFTANLKNAIGEEAWNTLSQLFATAENEASSLASGENTDLSTDYSMTDEELQEYLSSYYDTEDSEA